MTVIAKAGDDTSRDDDDSQLRVGERGFGMGLSFHGKYRTGML